MDLTSDCLREEAKAVVENLLPPKSEEKYLKLYDDSGLLKLLRQFSKELQWVGNPKGIQLKEHRIQFRSKRHFYLKIAVQHDTNKTTPNKLNRLVSASNHKTVPYEAAVGSAVNKTIS